MTRKPGWDGKDVRGSERLSAAHKLIMEASIGPGDALSRGRASRSQLDESLRKLRHAASIIEEVVNGDVSKRGIY